MKPNLLFDTVVLFTLGIGSIWMQYYIGIPDWINAIMTVIIGVMVAIEYKFFKER